MNKVIDSIRAQLLREIKEHEARILINKQVLHDLQQVGVKITRIETKVEPK